MVAADASPMEAEARLYEYGSCANPQLPAVPVRVLAAALHEEGPTRISALDLSAELGVDGPATSPNLLAAFIRLCAGESLTTAAVATSSCFYVIRGAGETAFGAAAIRWAQGDLFVLPGAGECRHTAAADGDAALYYVNDGPLLRYLGVAPCVDRFQATLHKAAALRASVEALAATQGGHRNRLGVLLGTASTEGSTKTLSHTLWSLLNLLPPHSNQPPHRHNSVALDLCISAPATGCYTLMGPELDERGWVKAPVRADWARGAMFTTPPGWWHSHHNETDEEAWVLPVQDAGLYTHQRTLDIRFSVGLPRGPSAEHLAEESG